MKIIYNADAITEPLTGIGRYALHLGQSLADLMKQQDSPIQSLRFFSSNRWLDDLSTATKSNQWISSLRHFVPFKHTALVRYHQMRSQQLKSLTAAMDGHLFHSPNFILMPYDGPSVATFHDLSFVHFRETQPKYRLKFLDQEIPKTLAQAQHIITPSEFVRQEIVTHYGHPASQISVTPLGVSEQFKPRNLEHCEQSLKHFGLSYRRFVLSVATNEPRKNLLRLLNAYQDLPATLKTQYPLVLVGSKGWKNNKVRKIIHQMGRKGEVICTGFVSQKQLHQLYSSAALTAFPSLYEGFGLPIIESMASGTPVLTANHSAMEEVAGGQALLINPEDTASIKWQLESALNDAKWRAKAAQAGIELAQKFTWENCARHTLTAYQSCIN